MAASNYPPNYPEIDISFENCTFKDIDPKGHIKFKHSLDYEFLEDVVVPQRRKLRISYTCSDFKKHHHKYRWTAYICGKVQFLIAKLR